MDPRPPRLPASLAAWGTSAFADTLKAELAALGPGCLPLHRLASTGHALETRLALALLSARDSGGRIEARLGVHFDELLPGCSCGDEAEPQPAYGELALAIDKTSALLLLSIVDD
jgi:hypothetical protein